MHIRANQSELGAMQAEFGIQTANNDAIQELTDRQLAVCLLASFGMTNKRLASQIAVSVRTVEAERHHVAATCGIATDHLLIWSVENRSQIVSNLFHRGRVPDAVAMVMQRYRVDSAEANRQCEYEI